MAIKKYTIFSHLQKMKIIVTIILFSTIPKLKKKCIRSLYWAGKGKEKKDSFAEKLAVHIIKNLQITIQNIHFRYEDGHTNPKHPFSVGVSLAELVFQVYNFFQRSSRYYYC